MVAHTCITTSDILIFTNHPSLCRGQCPVRDAREKLVSATLCGAQSKLDTDKSASLVAQACIEDGEDEIAEPEADQTRRFQAVRKMHINLGHPDPRSLARAIRVAGGSDAAVRAALDFRCETCEQFKEPTPNQPGRLH